jgi:hypothetical protein
MPSRKLNQFQRLVRSFKGSKSPVKEAAKAWRSKKSLCKKPRKWVKGKSKGSHKRKGHCRKSR